jgi:hypothetical protein
MEAASLGFLDSVQTVQRREACDDLPLDRNRYSHGRDRKLVDTKMMQRLAPSLIFGSVVAGMVFGATFLLFRKVTRTTALIAAIAAALFCVGAFWVLSPGH